MKMVARDIEDSGYWDMSKKQILKAELASVHSASPDIGASVQRGTFDALKRR